GRHREGDGLGNGAPIALMPLLTASDHWPRSQSLRRPAELNLGAIFGPAMEAFGRLGTLGTKTPLTCSCDTPRSSYTTGTGLLAHKRLSGRQVRLVPVLGVVQEAEIAARH